MSIPTLEEYLKDDTDCNDDKHKKFTEQLADEVKKLSSEQLASLTSKLGKCKDKVDTAKQTTIAEIVNSANGSTLITQAQIATKDTEIATKDTEIAAKEAELVAEQAKLAEKEADIAAKTTEIEALKENNQELTNAVNVITGFTTIPELISYSIPDKLNDKKEIINRLIEAKKTAITAEEARKAVAAAKIATAVRIAATRRRAKAIRGVAARTATVRIDEGDEEARKAAERKDAEDLARDRAGLLSSLDIKILLNNIPGDFNVIAPESLNNWDTKPIEDMVTLKTPKSFTMVTNKRKNIINDMWDERSVGQDTEMVSLTEFKDRLYNKALMLFGSSGSGKTYNSKRIITSLYNNGFKLQDIHLYYGTIDIDLSTNIIKKLSETFKFSEKIIPKPEALSGVVGKYIDMSFNGIKDIFNEKKDGDKIINFTTLINRQQGYVRQTINNPQSSRGSTVYKFIKEGAEGATEDQNKTFYLIDAPGSEDPFTILKGIFQYIRLDLLLNNPYIKVFFNDIPDIKTIIKSDSIKVLNRAEVLEKLPDKTVIAPPWKATGMGVESNSSYIHMNKALEILNQEKYVDITQQLSEDDNTNKKLRKIIVQLFMNFYTNSSLPANYSESNLYDFIPKDINQLRILTEGTTKNIEDYQSFYTKAVNDGFIKSSLESMNLLLGKEEGTPKKRYGPTKSTDIWGSIKDSIFKIIDNTRELIIQSYYITFQIGYISSIIRMKNGEIKAGFNQTLPVMFFNDNNITHFDMLDQEKFGYIINDIEPFSELLKTAKESGDYTDVHDKIDENTIESELNKNLFQLGKDIFLLPNIDITSLIVIPKQAANEYLVNDVISVNSKSIIDQLIGFPKSPDSGGSSKLGGSYSKLRRFSRKNLNGSGKINRNSNYRIKIKHSISTKKNKRIKTKKIKYLKKVTNKRRKIKRRKHKGRSLKRKTR